MPKVAYTPGSLVGANFVRPRALTERPYGLYLSCAKGTVDFKSFADGMENAGGMAGVDIRVMHEDIFNSMHRI